MTRDQATLLDLTEESLNAAKLLLRNRFPGFAVSRAYYTMFTAAEAALLSKELSFSKHSAVISAFGRHFAKTKMLSPELQRFILDAQQRRLAADYGGGAQVTRGEAAEDVRNAERFLGEVRKLLNSKTRER